MSTRITLEERGKTLEDEFFRKQERAVKDRLHDKLERERSVRELQVVSGIEDEVVLGHLLDAGVRAETQMALSLVPLVSVAWADGSVKDAERESVLRAAASAGIRQGTEAYAMLEGLLSERPSPKLFAAWVEYAQQLYADLASEERQRVAADIVGRARNVAEAAGGFLGLGSVSSAEAAVLDEIEAAFRGRD